MVSPLVSAVWLRQKALDGLRNVRILDASWTMAGCGRQAYLKERIPTAQHFDIDEVADKSSPYPHMIPSEREFEGHVGKLGVGNEDHVIVYDSHSDGMMSSPRVWWMFRVFGHKTVSVLDGGLLRWRGHGFPTEAGEPTVAMMTQFRASFQPQLVRSFEQMMDNHSSGLEQVVDARSTARFQGEVPEPRPGLPSGNMKGSLSVPYMNLINSSSSSSSSEEGTFRDKELLAKVFQEAGVDLDQPMVASCGSGVTAGFIALAASLLGKEIPLYDGSWTEWAQRAPPETMKTGVVGQPEDGA